MAHDSQWLQGFQSARFRDITFNFISKILTSFLEMKRSLLINMIIMYLTTSRVIREKCEEEKIISVLKISYLAPSKCSQNHIRNSLTYNIGCKPVPIVLDLPRPNNIEIQQVRF